MTGRDFPDIPDDLFDGFDWSSFDDDVVRAQVALASSLDDEVLNRLGAAVDGYEASKAKTERALAIVHSFLSMGLTIGRVVL